MPASHSLSQRGAHPLLPFASFSQRCGKTSSRPRKRLANSATLRCGVQDAVRSGSSSPPPPEIARSLWAQSSASSRAAASRAASSSRSLASTATIAVSNSPSTDTDAFCTHHRRARAAVTQATDGWPPLRFHDLRHSFASHLIIDLALDVVQVSRILGHASVTITLDVYTHLFDQARHSSEVRTKMAASAFAALIEPCRASVDGAEIVPLPTSSPVGCAPLTARQRAALRWGT